MTAEGSPSPMAELARLLRRNPEYMAYVLARFQEQEAISDEHLLQVLGTLPELAARLAVCRRPDVGAGDFAARVREISDFTLTDEGVLADVIRRVSSLEALSSAGERQLLSAARDREDPSSGDEDSQDNGPGEGKR